MPVKEFDLCKQCCWWDEDKTCLKFNKNIENENIAECSEFVPIAHEGYFDED